MNFFKIPSPKPKKEWRNADIDLRSQWINDMFLGHPQVASLLGHVGRRITHLERNHRPTAIAVLGGTGAGKTKVATYLQNSVTTMYPEQLEDRTIKPVVQFKIPTVCNPYEISVALLQALGEQQPHSRRDKESTIDASAKFLKTCQVRLVIVDNLQDVPERRGKRGIEIIAAHLRNLIDASSALWVFFGTDAAVRVLHGNDQFLRRVTHRAHLDYFRVDTQHARNNFGALLHQIDRWLPLAERSCIAEPRVAGAIFIATEGIFDRIVNLLDQAVVAAREDKTEALTIKHLDRAHVSIYGESADNANPFRSDFVPRLLDQEGEPFEVLHGGAEHVRRKA